ncbi:MAG: NADH-quinone oxidoreductase subunit J [Candidatus Margulisiibacteriota bacterium]
MSFFFLAGVLLFSAVMVVTLRDIFRCAIFLIIALLAMSGVYFYLGAPFVGVIQLLIYVGAIMVLVIFAIMLTSRISDKLKEVSNTLVIPAFVAAFVFLYFMLSSLFRTVLPSPTPAPIDAVAGIGTALMTKFALPFEVISLVLLAALIGAIVLVRKD